MKTAIVALLMCVSVVFAGETEDQIKSLKGIESIGASIEIANIDNAERFGLREREIGKIITDYLQKYEIKHVPLDKIDEIPGSPELHISVTPMIDTNDRACAILIKFSLRQAVRLSRDESIESKKAVTWSRSAVSLIKPTILLPGVRERVEAYMREFIEDHYKANGKESPFKEPKKELTA